ncbi:MAG: phosphotransferase family protein, partial [Acidimicrobiales bacterium]
EPADVRSPEMLARLVALIRCCHTDVSRHLRGPVLSFWVFHVLRDYMHTLEAAGSRFVPELPRLLTIAEALETAVGRVSLVWGHNDLLASNFMDDGSRLWLVDWDYAGFNSPLFDLGGLASNNQLDAAQEAELLEMYFEEKISDSLRRRYGAMKCASLLRESMWSMVSEHHSTIDFDYMAYTDLNLERFEAAWADFAGSQG